MKVKIEGKKWIELEEGSKDPDSFYIDGVLKKKLDLVKKFQKKDFDIPIVIAGKEGSGKSNLAFLVGWYLSDTKLTLDNIAFNNDDAMEKLEKLPDKSVLILDEAILSLMSKDAMTKEQKNMIKVFSVIRQKNMVVIIVIPSFFDLSRYIATHRAKCLLVAYTKGTTRGRFRYWGEKQLMHLYLQGKKNFNSYKKPAPKFRGAFTKFDPFGEEYQELKRKSLYSTFHSKPKVDKKQIIDEFIKEMIQGNEERGRKITDKELIELIGTGKTTFYRYKQMLKEGSTP